MPAPTPLPFDAFLDLLRSKGYGIGLHEYAAMAKLLAVWDQFGISDLGDALAALVGRSSEEVEDIRRLFNEFYRPAAPPPPPPPPTLDSGRILFLRRHTWSLAAASAVVLLAVAALSIFPRPVPASNTTTSVVPPVTNTAGAEAVTIPPPPPPDLPTPPRRIERGPASEAVASAFLVALGVFWSLKLRETARAVTRDAWTALRGLMPGPYQFTEIVRAPAHLPRTDVEDAATFLGRAFGTSIREGELDIPRSLRATLRQGLPTLVAKPRRVAEPILVLQDVCQEMRLWDPKVEMFLSDLRRQCIAPTRLYFDADLSRVSDRPHRPAKLLDVVLRGRSTPLMIVSSGSGLAATIETPDSTVVRLLKGQTRAAWLTPVSDLSLWPAAFGLWPVHVWPMTRLGLSNAARELAGVDAGAGPDIRARLASDGKVPLSDVERLKRLASLVPHPTPQLLDLLRAQFAPDISDAAILHLMLQADGPSAPNIRLKDEDLRRSLNAVRRENPDLEAAARATILEVLRDSEPAPGSMAHERWTLSVELQRLLLADLTGEPAPAAMSMSALRTLGDGPLWQEVQEALRLAPGTATMNARVEELSPKQTQGAAPPLDRDRVAGLVQIPWSWPGLREVVPALLAVALLFGGAVALNALPSREVDHVRNAYSLEYAPTPSASTPSLRLGTSQAGQGFPRQVDLYQEDRVFRRGIALTDGSPTVVQLAAADTGHYYQVRATLPQSNLAVSDAVWVASDRLTFVPIDAAPWANVTITGGQSAAPSQQTPFTAALLPGTYQLHFENPTLTPPASLDRTITVPAPDTTVYVVMPGFDAGTAVDRLMQQNPAIQQLGR